MGSILRTVKHSFTQYPLQQIFGTLSHIAILRVLNQLNQGISGRELSRRAGINDRTCRLALKRLEQLNVVENLGSGKIKLFRLNRENYFVEHLLDFLYSKERKYFNAVIDTLRGFLKNECTWACVFGSVAQKTDSEISDLDILVLVQSEQAVKSLQNRMSALISEIVRKYGLSLSPIILTLKQWNTDIQYADLKANIEKSHISITGESRE